MKKIKSLITTAAIAFYITACGNSQYDNDNNSDTTSADSEYDSSGNATGARLDTTLSADPADTVLMNKSDTSGTGDGRDTSHP